MSDIAEATQQIITALTDASRTLGLPAWDLAVQSTRTYALVSLLQKGLSLALALPAGFLILPAWRKILAQNTKWETWCKTHPREGEEPFHPEEGAYICLVILTIVVGIWLLASLLGALWDSAWIAAFDPQSYLVHQVLVKIGK